MSGFKFEAVENRDLMAAGIVGGLELTSGPQDPQVIGLLLPAVQKVREAASRMQPIQVDWNLTAGPDQSSILIGLLLPAVQKVR